LTEGLGKGRKEREGIGDRGMVGEGKDRWEGEE